MTPLAILFIYCSLIVLGSLVGGWIPSQLRVTHLRMQLAISFVGGLMIGVAALQMLPHAVIETGNVHRVAWWFLMGVLLMFGMLRMFHFHEHGIAEQSHGGPACEHDHDHSHPHAHEHPSAHRLSWTAVAVGLSLHTLLDGLALAASVLADVQRDASTPLLGLGAFLAILLHKPLDALSITTLMEAGRWPAHWQQVVNAAFASMCPLGAAMFFVGWRLIGMEHHAVVGCALGLSAGIFVCIALSDLLPEVQFHSHHRIPLTLVLLAGVAVAYAIVCLEPPHVHANPSVTTDAVAGF
ncbi:MAG: ZIP family metal transporter [Planctomycetales bacterium]|nr:ZIP family metal transporter [Planctomycetales bacterium]